MGTIYVLLDGRILIKTDSDQEYDDAERMVERWYNPEDRSIAIQVDPTWDVMVLGDMRRIDNDGTIHVEVQPNYYERNP